MVDAGNRVAGPVAVMGGTFDPIHHGHLRTALELYQELGFAEVRLVPCRVPVHRESPGCSAEQRLEMVRLAIAGETGLRVDDREVRRDQPSYMVTTLESLRAELGAERPLVMVLGVDAFLNLPTWHRWRELLGLAHILVVQRPGWSFDPAPRLDQWLKANQIQDPGALHRSPAGHILLHRLTPLEVSATQVRLIIAEGRSPRFLIPDAVWSYIQDQRLYR